MTDGKVDHKPVVLKGDPDSTRERLTRIAEGFFGDGESCEFVRVFILNDRFQADILADMFERDKVPVIIETNYSLAYDGIFIPQKGWGSLVTVKGFEERALRIIEAFKDAYPS